MLCFIRLQRNLYQNTLRQRSSHRAQDLLNVPTGVTDRTKLHTDKIKQGEWRRRSQDVEIPSVNASLLIHFRTQTMCSSFAFKYRSRFKIRNLLISLRTTVDHFPRRKLSIFYTSGFVLLHLQRAEHARQRRSNGSY